MNVPKPVQEHLERLYVIEQKSTVDIGKMYGVSARVVNHWMTDYGIKLRGKTESIKLARHKRALLKAEREANSETTLVIANEDNNLPVVSHGQTRGNVQTYEDDDISSSFMLCNPKQQKALELMALSGKDRLSNEEIAKRVGVLPATLKNWETIEVFQKAYDEVQKPGFIFRLKRESRHELLMKYENGEKITADDRLLAFKLTGDLGADSVVNNNTTVFFKGGKNIFNKF